MSPLVSVTDYFMGPELRAEMRAQKQRHSAIVARALARQRQRPAAKRARSAPAAPARPHWQLEPPPRETKSRWRLSQEPEHVEIRSKSASPITIALSARSWRTLRDLARESSDGKETGGFFFGPRVRGWHRAGRRSLGDKGDQGTRPRFGQARHRSGRCREGRAQGLGRRRHGRAGVLAHPPGFTRRDTFSRGPNRLAERSRLSQAALRRLDLDQPRERSTLARTAVHAWIVRRDGPLHRPVCEPALVTTN
jgi:hypothetical protein